MRTGETYDRSYEEFQDLVSCSVQGRLPGDGNSLVLKSGSTLDMWSQARTTRGCGHARSLSQRKGRANLTAAERVRTSDGDSFSLAS